MIRPALRVRAIISPHSFPVRAAAYYCYDVTDECNVYFELGRTLKADRAIKTMIIPNQLFPL